MFVIMFTLRKHAHAIYDTENFSLLKIENLIEKF